MYNVWDEQDELSWDNVLNKLSEFGPTFACNADNIEILSTPNEFYESLVENAANANDRILISTLYIGQGDREQNLVKTIEKTLKTNPNIEFSMIMDCSRATRNIDTNKSSLHTLLPLFNINNNNNNNNNYNRNVNIHLFRTPNLKGIWNYFPQRYREIVGVHHIKAFIFDNTLIISGANLNETYLNNRQDRYFIFKNNKQITNHIYNMIKKLTNYCPNVEYNHNQQTFNINMEINKKHFTSSMSIKHEIKINVENEPEKWINFVAKQLSPFTTPNKLNKLNKSNKSNNDTYIIMSTQMMNEIKTDSAITSCILSMPNIDLKISTAYFNLAHKYNQILLNTYCNIYQQQNGGLEILTASQQCNSFYKANGLAGYVTPLYQHFAQQFEYQIQNIHNKYKQINNYNLFKFHLYNRQNWTFHGKGIWIDFNNQNNQNNQDQPFSLTMIGSSNYGERSVHRDSELNFTILTKNKSLRSRLKQEWQTLTKYTHQQNNDSQSPNKSDESPSFFVGLMSGLVQNFM